MNLESLQPIDGNDKLPKQSLDFFPIHKTLKIQIEQPGILGIAIKKKQRGFELLFGGITQSNPRHKSERTTLAWVHESMWVGVCSTRCGYFDTL